MYEFIYCWALDEKIQLSTEDSDSLTCRIKDVDDKALVAEFIEESEPGNFLRLKDGVLISRVSKAEKFK